MQVTIANAATQTKAKKKVRNTLLLGLNDLLNNLITSIFTYVATAIYCAIIFKFPLFCIVNLNCYIDGYGTFLYFSF